MLCFNIYIYIYIYIYIGPTLEIIAYFVLPDRSWSEKQYQSSIKKLSSGAELSCKKSYIAYKNLCCNYKLQCSSSLWLG